ncbi:hypothetical protein PV08_02863 [Exophiala spinifera]|uniref:Uncharacterized protein n=1 Tax=Exophiala spinifera TaxID=91928 RepID=A0A0D2BJ32_9EURO|nr:uncharacterized protein PV08_02863 [Exophiala spinifera]KIW18575.1 hypothetical protein PV08_02863 [Exophiala spinifera]
MFSTQLTPQSIPSPSPFFAASRPSQPHFYTPVTPSPLRTSRNANLMPVSPEREGGNPPSSPLRLGSSPLGKFAVAEEEQNESLTSHRTSGLYLQKTPEVSKQHAAALTGSAAGVLATPPDSTRSKTGSGGNGQATFGFPKTQSTSAFSSLAGSASAKRSTAGTWEGRAQSLGSASALARHAAQGREQKKSQFLDRIRRRRDDARSELVGDQVLRMDFVRERRIWEDEMRRRAAAEAGVDGVGEVDIDMMLDDEEHAADEMSPTEEFDPELESYYDYQTGDSLGLDGSREGRGGGQHGDDFPLGEDEDEDDEYEEVFRELILRDQSQRGQGSPFNHGAGGGAGNAGARGEQEEYDAGMDLS